MQPTIMYIEYLERYCSSDDALPPYSEFEL